MELMVASEVYNIDCLEYMRTLPDKYFQLAVADPPYGINAPKMSYRQTSLFDTKLEVL